MEKKYQNKKPLNFKLDENLIVLKTDLFVFTDNNLYKFILKKGKSNRCNIISNGRLGSLRLADYDVYDDGSTAYFLDYKSKTFDAWKNYNFSTAESQLLSNEQKAILNQLEIKIGD